MRQSRGSRGEADKRQRTVGVPVCIGNWQGYKPTHCVTWWRREKEKLGKKSERERVSVDTCTCSGGGGAMETRTTKEETMLSFSAVPIVGTIHIKLLLPLSLSLSFTSSIILTCSFTIISLSSFSF